MKKKLALLLLSGMLSGLLTGCFFKSVDELYTLPKQSQEYYDLQAEIDKLMSSGVSYAAPTSGANQQSVQLSDLDGDGEDEAIVFLRVPGEKPLKAYVFDRAEESFQNVAVIEGDGSSFESVEYVQVDGEPGLELVLGRQVSDQVLQYLSVYTLRENRVVELMNTNYTEYRTADLDADGLTDLFVLRFDSEERTGVAEYYRYVGNQIEREPEVLLSSGVHMVKRIMTGNVTPTAPAVFVASLYEENSVITDIFAFRDDEFTNITTGGAPGTSAQTIRSYYVYATDIDNDGVVELPQPQQLPIYGSNEGGDVYWIINWNNLSLSGTQRRNLTTYHSYAGGWYLVLPEQWDGQITVNRTEEVSGVRGVVFSKWNGETTPPETIFTIYPFSGEDRATQAASDGRFLLGEKGDVAYGAILGTSEWSNELTPEDLVQMFHFIQVDWNSGET